MIGRHYGSTLLLVVFCVFMVSLTVGASHGFDATSVEDARITPDEYETDQDSSDYEPANNPWVPDQFEVTSQDVEQSSWAQDFVDYIVDLAMSFASAVAVFVYKNQSWMSPKWTAAVLDGATKLGIAVFFAWNLFRIKSLLPGVRGA